MNGLKMATGIVPKGSFRHLPVEVKQESWAASKGGFFKRRSRMTGVSPYPPRDSECEERKTQEYVENLMRSLTPREKNLIRLKFWEDKTPEEISSLLGISEESITPMLDDIFSRLYCVGHGEGENK